MLTLYYSPGASSVIPHITLEEIRAPYQIYTVSDPYAFFFYDLGLRIKLPVRELTVPSRTMVIFARDPLPSVLKYQSP